MPKRKGKLRFTFYLPTAEGKAAKAAATAAGQTISEWMRRLVAEAKRGG
jgi:hypothetical protein